MKVPVVSKESCFWFVETELNSLQPASIMLQIRVADVNIRLFEICSSVLGAWDRYISEQSKDPCPRRAYVLAEGESK